MIEQPNANKTAAETLCPVCGKVLRVNIFPDYLYCKECGLGVKRVEHRQGSGQARAVFSSAWVDKHYHNLSTKVAAHSITKRVNKLAGVRSVLDIGCASGVLVDMLAGEGYDCTGLDFSEDNINYAQLHNRGKYLCATVDDVKRKYDLVIMSHILEHIPDPVGYLRRVKHLVSPSGFLLVAVPNLDAYDVGSLWRRESCVTVFLDGHITAFSKRGLALLLEKAGYGILEVDSETLGASILNRLAAGVYRRLRGNPSIYKKREPASEEMANRVHRIYKTIAESKLAGCLCYIPNRLSERKGRGISLVVLATPKAEKSSNEGSRHELI